MKISINKIKIISMVLVLYSVVLHIVPYFFNRSLWIDEAFLAKSIITRNIFNLVATPLEYGQNAPIGYLYIVKLFNIIFGNAEWVLRIWSLITSLITAYLLYKILEKKNKIIYVLFFLIIFLFNDTYIYYANEAKQYMSDHFFTLLTLYIYQKYEIKEVSYLKMSLIFSIIIWFSFSAVFFIASIIIYECASYLAKFIKVKYDKVNKENKLFIKNIIISLIVLISFVLNYFMWLQKGSVNAGDSAYWDLIKFPIIPTSIQDIKLIITMIRHFFAPYNMVLKILFLGLMIYYICLLLFKKTSDSINKIIIISFILCIIASSFGYFPIQNRLVQSFSLTFIIISCSAFDNLITNLKNNNIKIFLFVILFLGVALTILDGSKNLYKGHVMKNGSEVKESIEYLKLKASNKDKIYVYIKSIPIYEYETNYTNNINNAEVIYGSEYFINYFNIPYSYDGYVEQDRLEYDIEKIKKNDSVYIFSSHDGESGNIDFLLNEIKKYGNVETVSNYYNTRLYHYKRG